MSQRQSPGRASEVPGDDQDSQASARRYEDDGFLRRAQEREAWVTSVEYRRSLIALPVALVVLALLIASNEADIRLWGDWTLDMSNRVDNGFYVVAVALVLTSYRRLQTRRFRDKRLIAEEQEINRRESELINEEATSVVELWQLTNERLRGYHERASRHADRSFRNAQFAIFGGLVIVAGTAGIVVWKTGLSSQSSIVVGVIGTVGPGWRPTSDGHSSGSRRRQLRTCGRTSTNQPRLSGTWSRSASLTACPRTSVPRPSSIWCRRSCSRVCRSSRP